jgi:KTSC domain
MDIASAVIELAGSAVVAGVNIAEELARTASVTVPVSSSAIERVGFGVDESSLLRGLATGTLSVNFSDGAVAEYPEAPLAFFIAFIMAPSAGSFYNMHIRGKDFSVLGAFKAFNAFTGVAPPRL